MIPQAKDWQRNPMDMSSERRVEFTEEGPLGLGLNEANGRIYVSGCKPGSMAHRLQDQIPLNTNFKARLALLPPRLLSAVVLCMHLYCAVLLPLCSHP